MTKPKPDRRIAIVGFAGSTREQAPFNDPSWEIWGMNELWRHIPKWDRWFDLHPSHLIDSERPGHLAWMRQQKPLTFPRRHKPSISIPVVSKDIKPIYLQEHRRDIPTSVQFPAQSVMNKYGIYFTSTPAWMLVYAIHLQPSMIGIWGVDMLHDSEYAYQRPCMDYWIGQARGRGIPVYIPKGSALAKGNGLYGYGDILISEPRFETVRFKERKDQLRKALDESLRTLYNLDGAIQGAQQFGVKDRLIDEIFNLVTEHTIDPATNEPSRSVDFKPSILDEYPPEKRREMADYIGSRVEEYRLKLLTVLTAKREEVMQQQFANDGARQEVDYWEDVGKHFDRGGV